MDRISGISDELLIKIISFLPTKVAVSTSILSKRWECLWMWLPNLEFVLPRGSSPSKRNSLRDFLDGNLPLHRAPVLDSFRLELNVSRIDPVNIKMWVGIAVSRRLCKLEIVYSSHTEKPNILPSNLYTCKSLVILKLDGGILLDVPRMVFLPSLKTLQLHSKGYFNDESLQRLLSNCPILEDLSVELHDNDDMKKLTVVVPSLQRLSLRIPCGNSLDGIVIETPSLKYFKLKDYAITDHYCLIKDMPNLIEAYLDVDLPLNINSVIGSITSIKRLTICSEDVYDEGFVFNQLEHLTLCRCKHDSRDLLVPLLKDSSNLQVLELLVFDDHDRFGTISWNQPSSVPECMLSSLQTVNWSGYKGEEGERDFAVYILENAVRLKTITINCCSESESAKFEMIKELALPSRASTTCKLMFDCLD